MLRVLLWFVGVVLLVFAALVLNAEVEFFSSSWRCFSISKRVLGDSGSSSFISMGLGSLVDTWRDAERDEKPPERNSVKVGARPPARRGPGAAGLEDI